MSSSSSSEQADRHALEEAWKEGVSEVGGSDAEIVTDEVWENERWGIDRLGRSRFGPQFLYPVERSHFMASRRVLGVIFEACLESRRRGELGGQDVVRTVDDEFWDGPGLPAGYEWLGFWRVDRLCGSSDGWLYGVNFSRNVRGLSPTCAAHHFVRTRRWVRQRRRVPCHRYVEEEEEEPAASSPIEGLAAAVEVRPSPRDASSSSEEVPRAAARRIRQRALGQFWCAIVGYPLAFVLVARCGSPAATRVAVALACATLAIMPKCLAFLLARRLEIGLGCDVEVDSVVVDFDERLACRVRARDVKVKDPAEPYKDVIAVAFVETTAWFSSLVDFVYNRRRCRREMRLESMSCDGVELNVEAVDDWRINCDLLAEETEEGASATTRGVSFGESNTLRGLKALGLTESVRRAGRFVKQCEAASNRLSRVKLLPSRIGRETTKYRVRGAAASRVKISVGASAWTAILRGSLQQGEKTSSFAQKWRKSVVEQLLAKTSDFCFELEVDRVEKAAATSYESANALCTHLGRELRELAAREVAAKLASEARREIETFFSGDDASAASSSSDGGGPRAGGRNNWVEQLFVDPLTSRTSAATAARLRDAPRRNDEGRRQQQNLVDSILEESPLGAAVDALGIAPSARRALTAGLESALEYAFSDDERANSRATSLLRQTLIKGSGADALLVEQYASLASTAIDALLPVLRAVRQTLEVEWKDRAPEALRSVDAAVAELDGIRRDALASSDAAKRLATNDESVKLVKSVLQATDTDRLLAVCARIADVVSCLERVATPDTVEKVARTLANHADAHVVAALTEKALELFLEAFRALPAGAFKGQAKTPLLGSIAFGLQHVDLSTVRVDRDQVEIQLFEVDGGTTVRDLAYFAKGEEILTPYGPATVLRYDAANRMYEVHLAFGYATLRPDCVRRRHQHHYFPDAANAGPAAAAAAASRKTPSVAPPERNAKLSTRTAANNKPSTGRLVESLDLATTTTTTTTSPVADEPQPETAAKLRPAPPPPRFSGGKENTTNNNDDVDDDGRKTWSPRGGGDDDDKRSLVDGLVSIRLRDLDAPLSGLRWSYSQEQWPYASDQGVADAELGGLDAVVTLATRRRRQSGAIYLCISQITVVLSKVSVAVRESKIAGLYNWLAATLATPLKDYVATSLESALKAEARLRLKPANDYLDNNKLWPLLLAISRIREHDIPFDDDEDFLPSSRSTPLFAATTPPRLEGDDNLRRTHQEEEEEEPTPRTLSPSIARWRRGHHRSSPETPPPPRPREKSPGSGPGGAYRRVFA